MIDELEIIDAVAADEENRLLILMISDHLGWEDVAGHLNMLKSKMSTYLIFIQTKQYESAYPGQTFSEFRFDICFARKVPHACIRFLESVAGMLLEQSNVTIQIKTPIFWRFNKTRQIKKSGISARL